MAMPRAGTLRALVVDAEHQAGDTAARWMSCAPCPALQAYTRLQLCVAGYKLLSGGLLHCPNAQRTLRYFATAEQAEAHATTLAPAHHNALPATGLQRAERREASAEGASKVTLRQARKDARQANAVAWPARSASRPPHPTPAAPPCWR